MLSMRLSALIGMMLLLGCNEGTRLRIPAGAEYAPQQWLVAWPQAERIVFLTEARWLLHDAAFTKCGLSGAYEANGGSVRPIRIGWGKEVCGEEVFEEKLRGSPDGREVAFFSDSSVLRWELLTGKLRRSNLRSVRATSPPAWAPDGATLAFAGIGLLQPGDKVHDISLYLLQADGSSLRKVAQLPGALVIAGPVWAPDQRRLAVSVRDRSDTTQSGQVSIVIVDTTGHVTSPIAMGYVQAWSPDGHWIAYVAPRPTTQSIVAPRGEGVSFTSPDGLTHDFISAAGLSADATLLSPPIGVAANGAMTWSPDGARMAVTLWTSTGMRIAIVRMEDHSISLLPSANRP